MRFSPGDTAPEPQAEGVARATNRRKSYSLAQYIEGILEGDRTILARAITLIESTRAEDRALAEQIVENCLPHSGNSIRLGITGVPGAGKSSLIEALGRVIIAERKEKVAVLAIDPSSQLSGGSVLGDKTRMTTLASSEMAFIRPSPSRGFLGGVAQCTREAMLLCEAAGYENIIIETIGTGQSETAVHDMVDFFLLIMLTGAGDELQGIKRGVMELADCVAVNKADGGNLAAAERARTEIQNALHYFPGSASGWTTRALTCSARTGKGITELWNCVLEQAALIKANGWLESSRQSQVRIWMHELIQRELRRGFEEHPGIGSKMDALEREIREGRMTSFRAARLLLEGYKGEKTGR